MLDLPPTLLTLPAPGEGQLVSVRRKVALLALRTLLGASPQGLRPPLRDALPRAQVVLTRVARAQAEALIAALLDPDVLTPLLVLESGLGDAQTLLAQAMPQLLIRLRLPEDLLWDVPFQTLTLPGRGCWRFEPAALGLRAGPDGVELRLADGQFSPLPPNPQPCFVPLGPTGVCLSLFDSNPLALVEDHPEKSGNSLDLGGHSPERWAADLAQALELVALGLPTWHAELPLALQRLIPVGYEPERHLSASYREAPRIAYLTLHPDPLTLAEAIVHETQHGKLNLLSWLDPVLHNGRSTWTSSPVRPDLRPLMGVLLAVHAFIPVAALHAQLADSGHPISQTERFVRRRAEVLASNQRGLDLLLPLAQPSALGQRLLTELGELHRRLLSLHAPLPAAGALEGPSLG